MPKIAVVTDSTADFAGDTQERLGIVTVPLSVTWDHDSYSRQDRPVPRRVLPSQLPRPLVGPHDLRAVGGLFEETYTRYWPSMTTSSRPSWAS